MQFYINLLLKISPSFMLLILIITVTCLIINIKKTVQAKNINKELLDCIVCKDYVLNEFTKIRHEYNNMLQTLTCFIEAEDLEGLKEYKSKLLEKTHLLNRNSITQLVKIKDINILRSVYKLFLNTKDEGVVLVITVYNDIINEKLYKGEFYDVLKECLIHAYQTGAKEAKVINLKISSNDNGLCFNFENASTLESRNFISKTMKSRKNKMNQNVISNTFYQNDHFIQEILISFNH